MGCGEEVPFAGDSEILKVVEDVDKVFSILVLGCASILKIMDFFDDSIHFDKIILQSLDEYCLESKECVSVMLTAVRNEAVTPVFHFISSLPVDREGVKCYLLVVEIFRLDSILSNWSIVLGKVAPNDDFILLNVVLEIFKVLGLRLGYVVMLEKIYCFRSCEGNEVCSRFGVYREVGSISGGPSLVGNGFLFFKGLTVLKKS